MKKENIKIYIKNLFQKVIRHKTLAVWIILVIMLFTSSLLMLANGDKRAAAASEQVWAIAGNIRNYYRSRPDAWGLTTETAVSEGMIPAEMLTDNRPLNALGKEILIGSDIDGGMVMPGSRSFAIIYKNLNESECREIATMAMSEKEQLGLTSMAIVNNQETRFVWGGENPLPISATNAKKNCRKNNLIAWFLYI